VHELDTAHAAKKQTSQAETKQKQVPPESNVGA
jgi:hypothetical protein